MCSVVSSGSTFLPPPRSRPTPVGGSSSLTCSSTLWRLSSTTRRRISRCGDVFSRHSACESVNQYTPTTGRFREALHHIPGMMAYQCNTWWTMWIQLRVLLHKPLRKWAHKALSRSVSPDMEEWTTFSLGALIYLEMMVSQHIKTLIRAHIMLQ